MKAVLTVIVLIALVIVAIFSTKWAMDRSKSSKTSLWRSFSGQTNPDDNLGRMGVGGVQGLKDSKKKE